MKLEVFDAGALRQPLIIFGAALILSIAVLWYADTRQAETAQALKTQNNLLAQARQKFFASGTEREVIVNYLPQYQKLIDQGLIGEERRVEWIHQVRSVNQQYKMFGINYTIDAQENYTPPVQLNSGPFLLHRSLIKLEVPLLHEADLLTLLDATLTGSFGKFLIRDCMIQRLPVTEKNKFVPYLHSRCEVDMVTMTEPPRVESKP